MGHDPGEQMEGRPAPQRWRRRPAAAAAVRLVAFAAPVAFSLAVTGLVSWALPVPDGGGQRLGWWALLFVVAVVTLAGADLLARRLLPLATMLRLSLVFPDRAPSRFRAALRTGTVHQLARRVEDVRRHGIGDDLGRAAATVIELAAAINAHDRRTRGHSERVRAFTDLVAEEMRLAEDDRDRLRWAALLHDVGKLIVPGEVLNRRGGLSAQDWVRIRTHPLEGERLVAPLAPWLGEWADAVGQHHEWWDGSGYPRGLSGRQIGLGARIVAVADAYEVMTAPRSYKRPLHPEAARAELVRQAGVQFDPEVVRALLAVSIGRLQVASGLLGWLAHVPFAARIPTTPIAGTAAAAVAAAGTLLGTGTVDLPQVPHEPAAVLGVTVSSEAGGGGPPSTTAAAGDVPGHPEDGGKPVAGGEAREATPSGVVPATPAERAVRADPGEPGGGATPATPAVPATPASPALEHRPSDVGRAVDEVIQRSKEPKAK